MRYLPASSFVRDLYFLGFVDFLFGMAIFTLRIGALHRPEGDGELFSTSVLLAAIVLVVSCAFNFHLATVLILGGAALMFPYLILLLVTEERRDAKQLATLESWAGLSGSVISALAIFGIAFFWVDSTFLSPLLRPVLIQIILFLILIARRSVRHFPVFSMPGVVALLARLGGLDYLALYGVFRIKALALLASSTGFVAGTDLSKAVLVLYDPIAGIMGYALRFRYAALAFDGRKYAQSVFGFFYVGILICLGFVLAGFLLHATEYNSVLFALALLFFSLFAAGITTQVVRTTLLNRILLLSGLILAVAALYFGIGLGAGLTIAIICFLLVLRRFAA